jgi:hypothetical protein
MSKYITKDKYEGLDPELAQALKEGKMIKEKGEDCFLYQYVSGFNCPYFVIDNEGDYDERRTFTPEVQPEIDWSKAKVKILKCSGETKWYKNQVGCIFKVSGFSLGGGYSVDFNARWNYYFIDKEDCELITG